MSSVIGIINLINVVYGIILHFYCQEHVTCRESEISNPKPTIKCFTKNHRLFIHN